MWERASPLPHVDLRRPRDLYPTDDFYRTKQQVKS
jgi:hypothetical protein